MEKEENILGTEKIGKLIRKFSIPCIISLLVNSLYNIVDQIFIGWGVGFLGNGATNIVFPLVVVALAFAFMVGDRRSSLLKLKTRRKEKGRSFKRGCKFNKLIGHYSINTFYNKYNIFTTIIKFIWMYRCIKTLCIRLWIYYSNRITIYNNRKHLKFYNKSRWKS